MSDYNLGALISVCIGLVIAILLIIIVKGVGRVQDKRYDRRMGGKRAQEMYEHTKVYMLIESYRWLFDYIEKYVENNMVESKLKIDSLMSNIRYLSEEEYKIAYDEVMRLRNDLRQHREYVDECKRSLKELGQEIKTLRFRSEFIPESFWDSL